MMRKTLQEILPYRQRFGFILKAGRLLKPGRRFLMPTGFAIALPDHHEAQVRPRSGLAVKHGVTVLNAPGTIDSDYRGEIKVPLINHGTSDFIIKRGDRIGKGK